MNRGDTILLELIKRLIPNVQHVAEIGVFMAKDCNMDSLIRKGIKCTLVEPQQMCIDDLEQIYGDRENVILYPWAIGYEPTQSYLYVPNTQGNIDAGASAYIDRDGSPYQKRTGENVPGDHKQRIEVVTFDTIDDGTIEAIHIDTEGHEWAVIKNMVSRPIIISLEMYGPNDYVNPHKDKIELWLDDNGYVLETVEEADVIYIRGDIKGE